MQEDEEVAAEVVDIMAMSSRALADTFPEAAPESVAHAEGASVAPTADFEDGRVSTVAASAAPEAAAAAAVQPAAGQPVAGGREPSAAEEETQMLESIGQMHERKRTAGVVGKVKENQPY